MTKLQIFYALCVAMIGITRCLGHVPSVEASLEVPDYSPSISSNNSHLGDIGAPLTAGYTSQLETNDTRNFTEYPSPQSSLFGEHEISMEGRTLRVTAITSKLSVPNEELGERPISAGDSADREFLQPQAIQHTSSPINDIFSSEEISVEKMGPIRSAELATATKNDASHAEVKTREFLQESGNANESTFTKVLPLQNEKPAVLLQRKRASPTNSSNDQKDSALLVTGNSSDPPYEPAMSSTSQLDDNGTRKTYGVNGPPTLRPGRLQHSEHSKGETSGLGPRYHVKHNRALANDLRIETKNTEKIVEFTQKNPALKSLREAIENAEALEVLDFDSLLVDDLTLFLPGNDAMAKLSSTDVFRGGISKAALEMILFNSMLDYRISKEEISRGDYEQEQSLLSVLGTAGSISKEGKICIEGSYRCANVLFYHMLQDGNVLILDEILMPKELVQDMPYQ